MPKNTEACRPVSRRCCRKTNKSYHTPQKNNHMRKLLLPFAICLFGGLSACRQPVKISEQNFPGIYVREVDDPTGTLWDTLCISWITDPPTHLFTVMKNSS